MNKVVLSETLYKYLTYKRLAGRVKKLNEKYTKNGNVVNVVDLNGFIYEDTKEGAAYWTEVNREFNVYKDALSNN